MNIIFISHLGSNLASGPCWSVPASVSAQLHIDNVYWLNTSNNSASHWEAIPCFHNISEFKDFVVEALPEPFNRPDIVIFEGFNFLVHARIARALKKKHIPYIIVPRGSLTYEALHNSSWLKKKIAHFLFFDKYINDAAAIQYLTKGEADSSLRTFKKRHFILPNGFKDVSTKRLHFSDNSINAIFIGRLDIYHKGIDLLFDAMQMIVEKLKAVNFHIDIYGPKSYDYEKIKNEILVRGLGNIACLGGPIGGKDKENAILNSDLYVMTSRLEGHPMGLVEALAYGIPCFVTKGTNMMDEIVKSDAGWACDGSVEDIKETLLTMIEEKDKLTIKGKNASSLSQNYKWDKIAISLHDEITKLI